MAMTNRQYYNTAISQACIGQNYLNFQYELKNVYDNDVIVYFIVPYDEKENFKKLVYEGTFDSSNKKWCKKCNADFLFNDKFLHYASLFKIHSIYDPNNILNEDNGYSTKIEIIESLNEYFEYDNLDKYLKEEEEDKERKKIEQRLRREKIEIEREKIIIDTDKPSTDKPCIKGVVKNSNGVIILKKK
jgi:hypothetical protein